MNWFVTGDTHRDFSRFDGIDLPEGSNVIILGDAGINYRLNAEDASFKKSLAKKYPYTFYCVRGNHEERPENIEGMETVYCAEVNGYVYEEPEYPNIKYFIDGGVYTIDNHSALVIGGAYSVDKDYRLARHPNGGWSGWFKDEQLTAQEQDAILEAVRGRHFDFILTHTCPVSLEPTDLFLGFVNQQTIDKSMELWLEKVKESVDYKVWLFGHFHGDRLERPGVEQYFKTIERLDWIWTRWSDMKVPWWVRKSPNYYMQ